MLNRSKNIRLFHNEAMEALSHVHPIIPGLMYLPLIGYFVTAALLQHAAWYAVVAMMAIGLLCWTLVEYLLHRLFFHFTPRGRWQERMFYVFHGIHHDDPNDATRLVMPPVVSIPLAVIFYGLYTIMMGHAAGSIFFSGFVLGYLAYDYTHFYIHHGAPTSAWGKLLRRQHYLHHHAHDGFNFGVSTPLWDFIFGTYVARAQPQQIQKYRAS